MSENMFNKEHKATNDKFRKGYDNVKWRDYSETKKNKSEKSK